MEGRRAEHLPRTPHENHGKPGKSEKPSQPRGGWGDGKTCHVMSQMGSTDGGGDVKSEEWPLANTKAATHDAPRRQEPLPRGETGCSVLQSRPLASNLGRSSLSPTTTSRGQNPTSFPNCLQRPREPGQQGLLLKVRPGPPLVFPHPWRRRWFGVLLLTPREEAVPRGSDCRLGGGMVSQLELGLTGTLAPGPPSPVPPALPRPPRAYSEPQVKTEVSLGSPSWVFRVSEMPPTQ